MSPEEQEKVVMRMLGPDTIYEKLDVSPSASLEQVKKAHRKLTKKIHSDKNNHPRADEAFKLIAGQVEMLMDLDRRLKYNDQLLQKSSPFLIHVKAGKSLTSFLVFSTDTISVVKDKLCQHWIWLDRYDKEEMLLGRPGWHLAGNKMEDDRRLLDYEVKQNQTLYLALESFGEQELKKELEEEKERSTRLEKQIVDQKKVVEQQILDLKNEGQVERDKSNHLKQQVLELKKQAGIERKRSYNLEHDNLDFKKKIQEDRVRIKRLQQQYVTVEQELVELKQKLDNAEELQKKLKEEALNKKPYPTNKRKDLDNDRVKLARLDKSKTRGENDSKKRSLKIYNGVKQPRESIKNTKRKTNVNKMVIRKMDPMKGKAQYVSRLVCSEVGCHMEFKSTLSIWKHTRSVHNGEKQLKCKECKCPFNRKEDLNNHLRKMHNYPKLVCKVAGCMVKFSYARTFRYHRQKHTMEV